MNRSRLRETTVRLCGSAGLLVFLLVLLAGPASAHSLNLDDRRSVTTTCSSSVSGAITTDTTWTTDCSPYTVTGDVSVSGATLTIQAGVTVRFNQSTQLVVNNNGKLVATGTAVQPIRFTGSTDQPGWWRGIQLVGTAATPLSGSQLAYVTIEDAGYSYGPDLYVEQAGVTVTHSTLQNSNGDGLYAAAGGVANLDTVSLLNNRLYAAEFSDGALSPSLATLTVSGNGTDAIGLGPGTISGTRLWSNLGVPYDIEGDQTVQAGASLTIQPGVTVRFRQSIQLTVNGILTATGTASRPVTLTGTTHQKGWWRGVQLVGTAANRQTGSQLAYVTIEDAGYSYGPDLYVEQAGINITHSTLQNSNGNGLTAGAGAGVSLDTVNLLNNRLYAAEFSAGALSPDLAALTVSGNGTDAIGFGGGTLTGNHIWNNLGVPYDIESSLTVTQGATLKVAPGTVVRFSQSAGMTVNGILLAQGTKDAPITFTATSSQPGWWRGITIAGTAEYPNQGSVIEYATIRYAGYSHSPQVAVTQGKIAVRHSVIALGDGDGFYAGTGGGGSSIEFSQVISNTGYGLENVDTGVVEAPNNWWGAVTGPQYVDVTTCTPNGQGSTIKGLVAFQPFLAAPDASLPPYTPGAAPLLRLSADRWNVPVGTLINLSGTLYDNTGKPLAGQTVRLHTTFGQLQQAQALTNIEGKFYVALTAQQAGTAEVYATLANPNSCAAVPSPVVEVTFTAAASNPLAPDLQAPYATSRISFNPMPVTEGVPTTVTVRLTNPNAYDIVVDGQFSYAQFGLGQVFGPLPTPPPTTIKAGSDGTISIQFVPPFSGHYCVKFTYTYHQASVAPQAIQPKDEYHDIQQNIEVAHRNHPYLFLDRFFDFFNPDYHYNQIFDQLHPPHPVPHFFSACAGCGGGLRPTLAPQGAGGSVLDNPTLIWGEYTLAQLLIDLNGQPLARQDYTTLATVQPVAFTPIPNDGTRPAAQVTAANAYLTSLMQTIATGQATLISRQRADGATAAGNLTWASQQTAAVFYYQQQLGHDLVDSSQKLQALLQELHTEGVPDEIITVAQVQTFQQQLRTSGFSSSAVQIAHNLGLTDDGIEQARQSIITTTVDTDDDYTQLQNQYGGALSNTGANLLVPPLLYEPGIGASAGLTRQPAETTPNLVAAGTTSYPVVVGNPLSTTATITLQVRPIDLPPDWSVTAPAQISLAPGQQVTVTVTVQGGMPVVQGTQPQVALEGYANGQLIGGVVLGVLLPQSAFFDGTVHPTYTVDLPVSSRSFTAGW